MLNLVYQVILNLDFKRKLNIQFNHDLLYTCSIFKLNFAFEVKIILINFITKIKI